ncbi:Lon protease family protein [Fusibacter sp. JL216-2]|uniref:Lon protease family protein n=1 Tax=Fusibacter sp. JL216-2 TaxID=3071453 RepID=UPI003D34FEC0
MSINLDNYKLTYGQLTAPCEMDCLSFDSTEELAPLHGIIGQERASKAMDFGLSIRKRGYNVYVSGTWGTGRNSYVRLLTEEQAIKRPVPNDWVYVNNFKDSHNPLALSFEPGQGKEFIKIFDRTIEFLKKEIKNVFNSKDYENTKAMVLQEYTRNSEKVIEELNVIGEKYGFMFTQNERGLVSIPLKEGEPMSEEEYRSITDDDYEKLRSNSNKLSLETVELFNKLKQEEESYRNKVKNLDEQMTRRVASYHLMNIRDRFKANDAVKDYLDSVVDDIVEHVDHFRSDGEQQQQQNPLMMLQARNTEAFFDRYKLNMFIDNSEQKHAPIVFASNPTYYNLMGRIEYKNELGMMKTDFTMIKPGALHEANGGYLIVLAKDILVNPLAWTSLKRALLDEKIQIESIGSLTGSIVSTTLKPDPVPLDVKIIVIGDPRTYQLLYAYDEEFRKLFKIMADFEMTLERDKETIEKLSRFIARHVHKDNLRHFTKGAVGRIIEFSSREADDQDKLSSHLNKLVDVLYESDSWAEYYGDEKVEAEHVEKALNELENRNNKIEEKVLEMFEKGDYLIDVDGSKVGEINGLAVMGTGQYRFGKPSKITVSTYKGRAGIVNIEREVKASGSSHDKGIMILTGYLGQKFAQKKPLALTAQVVFEQLYSGVDGDSASSTELYAILSSLAGVPIKQSIAVTGSVNQRGEIQPIGGVNEKIEGFFKVCQMKGLTGDQGVMIPHQNEKNLMLSSEVLEAVKEGKFHIYSVHTIDEGIEVLMDIKAGKRTRNGRFEKGSLYNLVDKRLEELAEPIAKRKSDLKNEKSEAASKETSTTSKSKKTTKDKEEKK